MNKTFGILGFSVAAVIFFQGVCLAGPARLLAMANGRGKDMNRIFFIFDRVPEFEVTHSGQRVRVVLTDTHLAGSFEKIPESEMISPLFDVKAEDHAGKSVIELYFRQIPEFVDVTVDELYSRFAVNVFWAAKRGGSRPAIVDRRFGRLRPIRDGAAAERMISSKYSGNWIDFFKEFEWKPDLRLPVRFSMPAPPGPLVDRNGQFLPAGLKEILGSGWWERAVDALTRLMQEGVGGRQADLYRLLLAQCYLHQGSIRSAVETLQAVEPGPGRQSLQEWRNYLHAYALAVSGRHFRAGRAMAENRKTALGVDGLAPWYCLLEAELDLAIGRPDQVPGRLDRDVAYSDHARQVAMLRKADALYESGRLDAACTVYRKLAPDLQLLQRHPRSLANWAALLYRNRQYETAYRYFFLLSETLAAQMPEKRYLADFWAAMALLRADERPRARLMLWEIEEKAQGMEAGFRARLKLLDLAVLGASRPDDPELLSGYEKVAQQAENRQVREEAFFKHILVRHLEGKTLGAVKHLGRFFDDYWAGPLMPEAQALLVEIFPEAIRELVKREAFFGALALVARHRDLLAQARITYEFLQDLAESYNEAGFAEQAVETYLYLLDFEKDAEKKDDIFLALIETCHRVGDHDRVLHYASDYLSRYPEGRHRARVLYYYAGALMEKGRLKAAAELLHENKRPATRELDSLAGTLFFEMHRYDLAEYYLSRAIPAEGTAVADRIHFKRAESLFFLGKWKDAAPLYERLMEVPGYRGEAGYRLVQIYIRLGRPERALNLYGRMSEMEIETPWKQLAGAAVQAARAQ